MTAPDLPCRTAPLAVAQADLEFAKWVAVITMFVDHYGKIVDPGIFVETHAIGRLSFPLFAAIVGIRLAARPARVGRYLRYLVPWAIVSQPAFVLAGRDWYDGNILITLALGVLATAILSRRASMARWKLAGSLGLIVAASIFVDYGPIGVFVIPAMTFLAATGGHARLLALAPLGLAANLSLVPPPLEIADFAALVAAPVLIFSIWAKVPLPRLPTQFFYAFYPGHLLALHFYDLYG